MIAETAKDKKAEDVVLMDMRGVGAFCDYFIVVTANNPRQVKAIADDIEEKLEEQDLRVWHKEGGSQTRWVLLDYGDCIAHLFEPEARKFYDLEGLWGDVPQERLS